MDNYSIGLDYYTSQSLDDFELVELVSTQLKEILSKFAYNELNVAIYGANYSGTIARLALERAGGGVLDYMIVVRSPIKAFQIYRQRTYT